MRPAHPKTASFWISFIAGCAAVAFESIPNLVKTCLRFRVGEVPGMDSILPQKNFNSYCKQAFTGIQCAIIVPFNCFDVVV
jgi:hypothetical protein